MASDDGEQLDEEVMMMKIDDDVKESVSLSRWLGL